MIDEKLKEKLQMYLMKELSPEEEKEIKILIEGSKEVRDYLELSRITFESIDKLPELEPSLNYMSDFWKKVEKEEKKKTGIFQYFNFKWSLAGSFAAFCLVSLIVINIFFTNGNNTNLTDEELLIQLDDSIATNTDPSLDVYGPWE